MYKASRKRDGRLAQLVRASRLHREGREFESLNAHQQKTVTLCGCFFVGGVFEGVRTTEQGSSTTSERHTLCAGQHC